MIVKHNGVVVSSSDANKISELKSKLKSYGVDISDEYDVVYGLKEMGYSQAQSSKLAKKIINASSNIFAADDDEMFAEEDDEDIYIDDTDGMSDQLDELQDNIEDIQDDVEDVTEDDPSIDVNNNIEGHYIAECDLCKGIFISAVIKSDQYIEKISGICPLCNKESEQFLKWIIVDAESDSDSN